MRINGPKDTRKTPITAFAREIKFLISSCPARVMQNDRNR